jgi:leucyl-tRNA synthetase
MIGTRRFVDRLWRLAKSVHEQNKKNKKIVTDARLISSIHKTIDKVQTDINGFAFNTAVSSLMILLNDFEEANQNTDHINQKDFLDFVKLTAPFIPHVADEIWDMFDQKGSVTNASWPVYDETKIVEDVIKVGIQINGKLRGAIEILAGKTEDEIIAEAKEIVKNHLEGKDVKKTIYVPGKIISFVI